MATRRADMEQGLPWRRMAPQSAVPRRALRSIAPPDVPVDRPWRSIDPSPFSRPFSRPAVVSQADRTALIERAAYYRAERRGFAPGHELEDWLAAEREIEQQFDRPCSPDEPR